MTYNWYYNDSAGPGELARLSNRQRSERAAWRSSLRLALAQGRTERRTPNPGPGRQIIPSGLPTNPQPRPVTTPTGEPVLVPVGGPVPAEQNEKSPALAAQ